MTRTWFPNTDNEIEIDVSHPHDWIKFNKDQMGYYITNYSVDMWKKLTGSLIANHLAFSVSDRVQLVNDAFMLADATQLDYKVALDMTRYLTAETQYVPWSVAATNLNRIRNLVYYDGIVEKVKKYGRTVIDKIYTDLGWTVKDDDHQNK